jgi:hypothetical protein
MRNPKPQRKGEGRKREKRKGEKEKFKMNYGNKLRKTVRQKDHGQMSQGKPREHPKTRCHGLG